MLKDELYTPEELADLLKISKYTVYDMIKRGDLPAHRIGRSLRISTQQLDRFLKKQGSGRNIFSGKIIEKDGTKFVEIKELVIRVSTKLKGDVQVHIPPEAIFLAEDKVHTTARNSFLGKVVAISREEGEVLVSLEVKDSQGLVLEASITNSSLHDFDIKIDKEMFLFFKVMSAEVF